MIVAVFNYHSSITTIIVKNDNILCINYTIKTETVREQVQNMLKRLLFSSRQAFLLSKQLAEPLENRIYPPQSPGTGKYHLSITTKTNRLQYINR